MTPTRPRNHHQTQTRKPAPITATTTTKHRHRHRQLDDNHEICVRGQIVPPWRNSASPACHDDTNPPTQSPPNPNPQTCTQTATTTKHRHHQLDENHEICVRGEIVPPWPNSASPTRHDDTNPPRNHRHDCGQQPDADCSDLNRSSATPSRSHGRRWPGVRRSASARASRDVSTTRISFSE
jgi:hypothetical protein